MNPVTLERHGQSDAINDLILFVRGLRPLNVPITLSVPNYPWRLFELLHEEPRPVECHSGVYAKWITLQRHPRVELHVISKEVAG